MNKTMSTQRSKINLSSCLIGMLFIALFLGAAGCEHKQSDKSVEKNNINTSDLHTDNFFISMEEARNALDQLTRERGDLTRDNEDQPFTFNENTSEFSDSDENLSENMNGTNEDANEDAYGTEDFDDEVFDDEGFDDGISEEEGREDGSSHDNRIQAFFGDDEYPEINKDDKTFDIDKLLNERNKIADGRYNSIEINSWTCNLYNGTFGYSKVKGRCLHFHNGVFIKNKSGQWKAVIFESGIGMLAM